jgi:hypothetical protein
MNPTPPPPNPRHAVQARRPPRQLLVLAPPLPCLIILKLEPGLSQLLVLPLLLKLGDDDCVPARSSTSQGSTQAPIRCTARARHPPARSLRPCSPPAATAVAAPAMAMAMLLRTRQWRCCNCCATLLQRMAEPATNGKRPPTQPPPMAHAPLLQAHQARPKVPTSSSSDGPPSSAGAAATMVWWSTAKDGRGGAATCGCPHRYTRLVSVLLCGVGVCYEGRRPLLRRAAARQHMLQ